MLVYGRNVAKEILKKNQKVKKITLLEGFSDKEINSLLENKKIPIEYLDKKGFYKFDKYSHQGIILDIEDFSYVDYSSFYEDNAKVVILDHLEDPHNLGAIIRTCEAAGITGVIIPKDRSVEVNSTVMKTSAGALENVKISQVTNLVSTINDLKKNGFWIVGTALCDNSINYKEIDYSGKIALVIGNEGKGMSKSVLDACDYVAKIPMYGKINSLNASVACGIMIYEMISLDK